MFWAARSSNILYDLCGNTRYSLERALAERGLGPLNPGVLPGGYYLHTKLSSNKIVFKSNLKDYKEKPIIINSVKKLFTIKELSNSHIKKNQIICYISCTKCVHESIEGAHITHDPVANSLNLALSIWCLY